MINSSELKNFYKNNYFKRVDKSANSPLFVEKICFFKKYLQHLKDGKSILLFFNVYLRIITVLNCLNGGNQWKRVI